jgi:hypothetical protein
MGIGFVSTYRAGLPGNEEIDIAHKLLVVVAWQAILAVAKVGFRPGMPEYGQKLHDAFKAQIYALGNPNFHTDPVYLDKIHIPFDIRLPGSSVPDVVYGPLGHQLAVFELKTGRVANTATQR